MLVSVATFIFFEVYKMAFTSRSLAKNYATLSERIKGKPAGEVLAELQKVEAEAKSVNLRFMRVWMICLAVSVVTGLAAVAILASAFLYELLNAT